MRVIRRLAILSAVSLTSGVGLIASPTDVGAESAGLNAVIRVTGQPLSSLTTSPLALTPTFDPAITDYVLRCQAGVNVVHLTLTGAQGGAVSVAGNRGHNVSLQQTLIENQALVITATRAHELNGHGIESQEDNFDPQHVQYWIRCLPHDFPQLKVTRPGTPAPGWYLTSNVVAAAGSSPYAMVLDAHGTPVWYRKSDGGGPLDVTLLTDHSIAWMSVSGPFGEDPKGAFEVYDLRTRSTSWLPAPIPPTDGHELELMPSGHVMMLSTPLRPSVDLSVFGLGASATIVDCVVQELDRNRNLIWQWRASDHISPAESVAQPRNVVNGQVAYDIFHCNSVDSDPVSHNVVLSARHTDAVYLIDKASGKIAWKMGGNEIDPDHAVILTITGDPQGAFHAQHDARFEPQGDISLFDDQTWNPANVARAVEYHVDLTSRTAMLVWSFLSPDGRNSGATGSFERLGGGQDNVICWGFHAQSLFTEVDSSGRLEMNVTFPAGDVAYRVIKFAPGAVSHDLLRATAGSPQS
jgi:hypothetical protein